MTTMRVVGECFFWYRLTRVFPDKFHRAVKRLCELLDVTRRRSESAYIRLVHDNVMMYTSIRLHKHLPSNVLAQ